MSKTVTLRLNERVYELFSRLAERDNRPLSNFIETAVLRFIEVEQFVDDFEMEKVEANKSLNASIKRGHRDANDKRGQIA